MRLPKCALLPERDIDIFPSASLLMKIAEAGHIEFARKSIAESGAEQRLFPLTRALDFMLTGDHDLLERTAPHVRSIVEEIVRRLSVKSKPVSTTYHQKKPSRGPKQRLSKRL